MELVSNLGVLAFTVTVMLASFELGHRLAARRGDDDEKEAPVSAVSGAVFGLAAFMLAFTFGSAVDRFNNRKELVRQ